MLGESRRLALEDTVGMVFLESLREWILEVLYGNVDIWGKKVWKTWIKELDIKQLGLTDKVY